MPGHTANAVVEVLVELVFVDEPDTVFGVVVRRLGMGIGESWFAIAVFRDARAYYKADLKHCGPVCGFRQRLKEPSGRYRVTSML